MKTFISTFPFQLFYFNEKIDFGKYFWWKIKTINFIAHVYQGATSSDKYYIYF